MSRTVWNAEHGWHETDDEYRLTLLPDGRIHWVITEPDDDDSE